MPKSPSELLNENYIKKKRSRISMDRAMDAINSTDALGESDDTTYLTVADKDGMMVSLIQSLSGGFGSGLVPSGLGFALQNRGSTGFSLDPEHPSVYAPGKRPFHTIIPAFVTKGNVPVLSFGLSGGSMQPQGHVQILVNILDFGLDPQEAGDATRFRHIGSIEPRGGRVIDYYASLRGETHNAHTDSLRSGGNMGRKGRVLIEPGVKSDIVRLLKKRGHDVEISMQSYGGYQAIYFDENAAVYWGASEMRKDGSAVGY